MLARFVDVRSIWGHDPNKGKGKGKGKNKEKKLSALDDPFIWETLADPVKVRKLKTSCGIQHFDCTCVEEMSLQKSHVTCQTTQTPSTNKTNDP